MKLKLLAAAMMAAGLALSGCASHRDNAAAGTSRTAGETASDAALTAKVKTAIASDASLGTAANDSYAFGQPEFGNRGFQETGTPEHRLDQHNREVRAADGDWQPG